MIVVGWSDIPRYAIDCINYLNLKKKIIVLTNNNYSQKILKSVKVKIIDLNTDYSWDKLKLKVPNYFFFTGWNNKAFISLAKEKKSKNICLIDNTLKNNFRQFIGKIYFSLFLNKIFDAVFIPGKNSKKLMNYFNFEKEIYEGLYSCNNKLFKFKKKITERKFDFIFVGKFINRKNLKVLLEAFKKIRKKNQKAKLLLIGGKLNTKMRGVTIMPHIVSEKISKLMNNSKCLILPSTEEHWGVVVHESVCAGCLLILSNNVGSKKEFLNGNGYDFDPQNVDDLYKQMQKILNLEDKNLIKKSLISVRLSKKRSLELWKKQFFKIINDFNK